MTLIGNLLILFCESFKEEYTCALVNIIGVYTEGVEWNIFVLKVITPVVRKQVKNMPEHQTIEWKESWHDEFLEWICGYANAYGGTLYIGKNDNGDVVGLSDKDRKKLLEVIPNKITDTMGIVADVNLLYEYKYCNTLKLLWTSTLR